MLRRMSAPTSFGDDQRRRPFWQRLVPGAGLVAAGFTTLCCLGISAALSLATSVGATFLTTDRSLKPLLALTLLVTAIGSSLTFWRHRHPGPLLLTVFAGVWVYAFTFVIKSGAHAAMHDDMSHANHHGAQLTHAALSGGQRALVWLGLGVLITAQLWDVLRVRSARHQREGQGAGRGAGPETSHAN